MNGHEIIVIKFSRRRQLNHRFEMSLVKPMNKDNKICFFMRADKLNLFEILCISGNFWQAKRFYIVVTWIKFLSGTLNTLGIHRLPRLCILCVSKSLFKKQSLESVNTVSRISLKRKVAGLLTNITRITVKLKCT